MRPRVAVAFHFHRHSEFCTHHSDAAFVLGADALAPVSLVTDRRVNHLELDATNEHSSVAIAVSVSVDPKRHN